MQAQREEGAEREPRGRRDAPPGQGGEAYGAECRLGRATSETARIQVRNIAQAVELHYLDRGAYPTDERGLRALVQPVGANWRGPYVRDARSLIDPWGKPYLYRTPGASPYEVYALGSDGKLGGSGAGADVASD